MNRTVILGSTRPANRPWPALRAARHGLTRLRVSIASGARANEPAVVALAAVVGLSAYFMVFPNIDLVVSRAFYQADAGFILAGDPMLRALRRSSSLVLGLLLAALLVTAVASLFRRLRRGQAARRAVYLLAGLAIGPGLVVNTVLKGEWGRPRPIQVDAFGGEAAFSPAWWISDACQRNCSFVSGEAASAAWMVAVVLVMCPARWRSWAVPLAITYAVALSLNRLAFGGHFLSDILLSWAIVGFILCVLHRLVLTCPREMRRHRRLRARSLSAAGLA